MQLKHYKQIMSDGYEIFINRWIPDSEQKVKGIIQLHHGIQEHSLRYDRLGSILADNGYILNGYDMRGHGLSAENSILTNTGMFGKLADKDGFYRVVQDLYEITNDLKNIYLDIPIFLLGHSFGSFVAQSFIEQFGETVDGVILSGTLGPNKIEFLTGKIIINLIRLFKGSDFYSSFVEEFAQKKYNKKLKKSKSKNSWVCGNENTLALIDMDRWCGFPLTTSFYCDMVDGLLQIYKLRNIKKIPIKLPILLIYGEHDPIGHYGKTVKKLYKLLKNNQISNVAIKEYKGDKHEILNERDCEKVENDIIEWLSNSNPI